MNVCPANQGQAGDVSFFPLMLNCLGGALGVLFGCWGCSASPHKSWALLCNESNVEFSPDFNREPFEDTERALVIHALLFISEQPYCCSGQGAVLHPRVGAPRNRCNGACKWGCFGETLRRALLSGGNWHQDWGLLPSTFPKLSCLDSWLSEYRSAWQSFNPGLCSCKSLLVEKPQPCLGQVISRNDSREHGPL